MKTVNELFELLAQATKENGRHDANHWFVSYSGHVNKMDLTYHPTGWSADNEHIAQRITEHLSEEGVQALYWFVKTRLRF